MDLIGKQYHTLTVLINTPVGQGAGNRDAYTTLLTTRCSLDTSSGSRSGGFATIEGGSSCMITTRYQTALWSAITMSMKFEIDGIRYTLQGWERVSDRRKNLIRFNVSKTNG